MTDSQAAYGRAHAAVVLLLPELGTEAAERATEVLGRLSRLGWRWSPALTQQTEPDRPAAPPPTKAWEAARAEVAANAAAARAAEGDRA